MLWTLAGATLISWAFVLENGALRYGWAALLAIVAGLWGLGTVIVSWVPDTALPSPRVRELLAWGTALLTILSFGGWLVLQLHLFPQYGTDELAFDQYAAELLRRGMNPYVHSMAPSFPMFSVSPGGFTYTLTGARVIQVSYPALSFLVYLPFMWLGWTLDLAPGLEAIGWSLAVLLTFRLLPRSLRPAALILGSLGAWVSLASIGLTDLVFTPLLVIAAYRWDRFDARDWRTFAGPVAMGLAMASKQTPWPILPFILAGLICDDHARAGLRAGAQRAGRYLIVVLVTFLVPNLAFIVMSPSAWVTGTLSPLIHDLVPAGQGAIGFSLFLGLGGGSLFAITLLSLLVLILLLVVYIGAFPLLKAATFVLPAIAYFFAVRSYAIYLVSLVPPGLVGAATMLPPATASGPNWRARWVRSREWLYASAGLAAVTVAVAVYALAAGGPLGVRIVDVQARGSYHLAQRIVVRVTNHSGSAASPAFTLQTASGVTTFWHIWSGPRSLPAGATAQYTLLSPNAVSELSALYGLRVVALLASPGSVSVSNLYAPPQWHVGFNPQSFADVFRPGRTLHVRLQLLSDLDGILRRPGVPIRITQSPGGRDGIASLNGNPAGASATVLTDPDGAATLTIVGLRASSLPVLINAQPPNRMDGYITAPLGPGGPLEVRFDSP